MENLEELIEDLEEVKVIDNFLPEPYFKYLQRMVTSDRFPWTYVGEITNANSDNELASYGFDFTLLDNGTPNPCGEFDVSIAALEIIRDYVGSNGIIKARFDMTTYNPENYLHPPHIDNDQLQDYTTAILYMNDSDGDTIIYNEKCSSVLELKGNEEYTIKKTVEPKENRLVVFDGYQVHTGHSPSKHKTRILLNIIFDKEVLVFHPV